MSIDQAIHKECGVFGVNRSRCDYLDGTVFEGSRNPNKDLSQAERR